MKILNTLSNDSVVQLLRQECLGIIPTDSGYQLVCRAASPFAVERLYDLVPNVSESGVVIAYSIEQVAELGVKRRYLQAVSHMWPSRVSILLPNSLTLSYLDRGKKLLPVRIPLTGDGNLQSVLGQVGPLLTAEYHGGESIPKDISAQYSGKIDFCVDVGSVATLPSTIIRIVDDAIEVVRQGATIVDEATGRIIGLKE